MCYLTNAVLLCSSKTKKTNSPSAGFLPIWYRVIIIPKTQTEKLIVPASRFQTPLSKRCLSLGNVSEQRRSERSWWVWLHLWTSLSPVRMDVLWICDVVPPLYKYLVQMELCCWDGRSSQPVISQGRTQYDSISTAGKWSMPCSARHWALIWPDKTFSSHIMLIKG